MKKKIAELDQHLHLQVCVILKQLLLICCIYVNCIVDSTVCLLWINVSQVTVLSPLYVSVVWIKAYWI